MESAWFISLRDKQFTHTSNVTAFPWDENGRAVVAIKETGFPAFLQICPQKSSVNSPINLLYFSIISTRHLNFARSAMAHNTYTHMVKFGDGNINSGNINDSFNTTVHQSNEDAQILSWLSPLEPGNRHHGVRTNRFEGVGDWLFGTGEMREWRGAEGGTDKAVMFCSGNPGVGKTYLT